MRQGLSFLKKNFPGLLVLSVAMLVYGKTMAPTVSFWDSGEFIASGALLQIPHPPGAPLYLMLARIFSLLVPFTPGVAFSVNLLSAVASAFVVFFFYKILRLLFVLLREKISPAPCWVEEVSAVAGALLFAFTDTFWYSAVEAEVYALSLFFSAVTFWVFLKWYGQEKNDPRLFYVGVFLLGLSVGVHLLNLLMTPVFVLLFAWKQFGVQKKSTLYGLLAGFLVLGIFFLGWISGGLWPAMKMEILVVNNWNWPQQSGLVIWLSFVVLVLFGGLFISYRKHPSVHFGFMVAGLFFLGWTSYLMVPIRASANPYINMNAPDDVFSLHNYINRTQYGSRPLVFGPHAWATAEDWNVSKRYVFNRDSGCYELVPAAAVFEFSPGDKVFFPRMYSRQSYHIDGYEWWSGLDGNTGKPQFAHQMDFFLKYQLGHSYLRYVLWNFVGRQNDEQGHGDVVSGNWVSGIDFIDRQFLGSREHLHSGEEYSAAANHFYGLPLIFVFLGLFFLLRSGHGRLQVLLLLGTLFLITGPLLVLYLNQPPYEPRERDYVYVASFMALAMFGAMGFYALLRTVWRYSGSAFTTVLFSIILILAGPGLLFSGNLNDHDRSERFLARDLAASQLRSCPPNSILVTYGDNDTYPLWYVQQIEKVRPDIRIVNLGLLHAFWYQRYLRQEYASCQEVRMTLPSAFYRNNATEFVRVSSMHSAPVAGIDVLQNLAEQKTNKVVSSGLPPVWELNVPGQAALQVRLQRQYLSPGDLALLDIVATNGAKRPVCFTRNVDRKSLGALQHHLQGQGLVLLLNDSSEPDYQRQKSVDSEYSVFTDSIAIGRNETWYDHTCRQALANSGYREFTLSLAQKLLDRGGKENAQAVLRKSLKEWPFSPMQDQNQMLEVARLLAVSDDSASAMQLVDNLVYVNLRDLYNFYYSGFDLDYLNRRYCDFFTQLHELAQQLGMNEKAVELEMELQRFCMF